MEPALKKYKAQSSEPSEEGVAGLSGLSGLHALGIPLPPLERSERVAAYYELVKGLLHGIRRALRAKNFRILVSLWLYDPQARRYAEEECVPFNETTYHGLEVRVFWLRAPKWLSAHKASSSTLASTASTLVEFLEYLAQAVDGLQVKGFLEATTTTLLSTLSAHQLPSPPQREIQLELRPSRPSHRALWECFVTLYLPKPKLPKPAKPTKPATVSLEQEFRVKACDGDSDDEDEDSDDPVENSDDEGEEDQEDEFEEESEAEKLKARQLNQWRQARFAQCHDDTHADYSTCKWERIQQGVLREAVEWHLRAPAALEVLIWDYAHDPLMAITLLPVQPHCYLRGVYQYNLQNWNCTQNCTENLGRGSVYSSEPSQNPCSSTLQPQRDVGLLLPRLRFACGRLSRLPYCGCRNKEHALSWPLVCIPRVPL